MKGLLKYLFDFQVHSQQIKQFMRNRMYHILEMQECKLMFITQSCFMKILGNWREQNEISIQNWPSWDLSWWFTCIKKPTLFQEVVLLCISKYCWVVRKLSATDRHSLMTPISMRLEFKQTHYTKWHKCKHD